MGLIGANELKKKAMIALDGQPFVVLDVVFASPSARSSAAMVKVKVRNLLTGAVLDKNFKTGEKFDEPDVEMPPASFLYADVNDYHFMDDASYEQFSIPVEKLKDIKGYIREGLALQAMKYNEAYVSLELPPYVELKVTTTEPGVRGDSSGSVLKPATLETGLQVRVPIYVKEGDVVRVNTQTGEVAGRA